MNMWALNEVRGFRPHVLRRLNHGILLVGHFRDRQLFRNPEVPGEVKGGLKSWLRLFSGLCLLIAIVGVAMFYLPIKDLGVAEAYETTWVAIPTEVLLKVVITPLLEAIVFALLDIGWQLKEARQES
jgi:hypothetical protein